MIKISKEEMSALRLTIAVSILTKYYEVIRVIHSGELITLTREQYCAIYTLGELCKLERTVKNIVELYLDEC